MQSYLSSLTFDFHDIAYTLAVGFIIGVAVATLLYIHLTNGIRITMTQTRHRIGCDERHI